MTISLIGSSSGVNSATMPAHQTGDLLLIYAFRDGSTTPPTSVAGWTNILTNGANSCSGAFRYKIATSSSEVTGTWTNATGLIVLVYRSTTGSITMSAAVTAGAASTTIDWPQRTSVPPSDGIFIGVVGHRSIDTGIEVAPTGMSNITSFLDATNEVAAHSTVARSGFWAAQSQAVGGTSSGWRCYVIEISDGSTSGVASSTGTSTASGIYSTDNVFSSSGTSTASATGTSLISGAGSSTGTSTVSSTATATAMATASSSGTNTTTGTITALTEIVYSSSGTSTVSGIGSGLIEAVFNTTASSSPAAIGTAEIWVAGSSAGVSNTSVSGLSFVAANGSISATSSADSVGRAYISTIFSTTSTSQCLATGSALASGVGAAAGGSAILGSSINGWIANAESNSAVAGIGAILIEAVPYTPATGIGWQSPAGGPLDALDETLANYVSVTLSAEINDSPTGVVFEHVAGTLPENLIIVNNGNGTGTLEGDITELDEYIPGWQEPPGFTYDTSDTAGGNYASYGSALYGGKNCTFVIRAYREGELDSNGSVIATDRVFSINIDNNYSSDARRFILEYYAGQRLTYVTNAGVKHENLTPEEYADLLLADGYITV